MHAPWRNISNFCTLVYIGKTQVVIQKCNVTLCNVTVVQNCFLTQDGSVPQLIHYITHTEILLGLVCCKQEPH